MILTNTQCIKMCIWFKSYLLLPGVWIFLSSAPNVSGKKGSIGAKVKDKEIEVGVNELLRVQGLKKLGWTDSGAGR